MTNECVLLNISEPKIRRANSPKKIERIVDNLWALSSLFHRFLHGFLLFLSQISTSLIPPWFPQTPRCRPLNRFCNPRICSCCCIWLHCCSTHNIFWGSLISYNYKIFNRPMPRDWDDNVFLFLLGFSNPCIYRVNCICELTRKTITLGKTFAIVFGALWFEAVTSENFWWLLDDLMQAFIWFFPWILLDGGFLPILLAELTLSIGPEGRLGVFLIGEGWWLCVFMNCEVRLMVMAEMYVV
jgi:hypothetical protein